MRSSVVKGLTSKRNAFNFYDLLNIGTYARCLRLRAFAEWIAWVTKLFLPKPAI